MPLPRPFILLGALRAVVLRAVVLDAVARVARFSVLFRAAGMIASPLNAAAESRGTVGIYLICEAMQMGSAFCYPITARGIYAGTGQDRSLERRPTRVSSEVGFDCPHRGLLVVGQGD